MKNKTIFFLLGSFKVGGVEKVASLLAKNFIESGYDVKIILLKNLTELPVENINESIVNLNTERYKNKIIKIIAVYWKLWRLYFQHKPHRIISFSSGLNVLLFFSFLPKQVYRIDTNLFWVKSKLYRRRILKTIGYLPNIKKVITPSHELTERFKPYLPKASFKKFVTIHNPLSQKPEFEKDLSISKYKKPYFVSVGRLNRGKGFEQLIRCFSLVDFERSIFLYIAGSGPMEDELKCLIEELDIGDRVKLLGFVKHPQSLIRNSEALILNSSFESFGNVFIEALSLGVPVISNDCDFGPREIIEHRVNGLLFKQEKNENLIEALEEYINNVSLNQKLKENTSFKLERFNATTITQEWIEKILK